MDKAAVKKVILPSIRKADLNLVAKAAQTRLKGTLSRMWLDDLAAKPAISSWMRAASATRALCRS